uniref:Acidic leucine-rich nuclear phosphoprotein 32 family member A-like isoform X2 n=1 Tax=Crassostrea virginica TaxID=6565 RepID=A0A8B8BTH4_CRAVI|nr:acidic leucine-rich nuclear phosphoprotein 32 family member A-like isoform X2 [Crassostrea virginica]
MSMEMAKRIELEKRGRKPSEILELNLDSCRAPSIDGLTEEYSELESLSLINVGLTTLKGFPSLPKLQKLELSDNRIQSGLQNLQGCPSLTHLSLSGNKIKEIDTLRPLKNFSELKHLDLFNCEVTQLDDYREQVFELLPNLKYLDGFDKNDKEADDDEEDGEDGSENDDDEEDEEDQDNEVIFANSLPSAEGAAATVSSQKKKRKSSNYDGNIEGEQLRTEFLRFEREKHEEMKEYRKRKLDILEEMLQLQRRSTMALELIATKCQSVNSPYSISPVIKLNDFS